MKECVNWKNAIINKPIFEEGVDYVSVVICYNEEISAARWDSSNVILKASGEEIMPKDGLCWDLMPDVDDIQKLQLPNDGVIRTTTVLQSQATEWEDGNGRDILMTIMNDIPLYGITHEDEDDYIFITTEKDFIDIGRKVFSEIKDEERYVVDWDEITDPSLGGAIEWPLPDFTPVKNSFIGRIPGARYNHRFMYIISEHAKITLAWMEYIKAKELTNEEK